MLIIGGWQHPSCMAYYKFLILSSYGSIWGFRKHNIRTDELALSAQLQDRTGKDKSSEIFFCTISIKKRKNYEFCVYTYVHCHVPFQQERISISIWRRWKANIPRVLFCMSENWKNFPQTSSWLCEFQTLSLSYYPPMSGARHYKTLCYQLMISGPAPSYFAPRVCELAERMVVVFLAAISSSKNLSTHTSDWEIHKYIPLNQTKYVPLAKPQKCLQPRHKGVREGGVETVALSNYS